MKKSLITLLLAATALAQSDSGIVKNVPALPSELRERLMEATRTNIAYSTNWYYTNRPVVAYRIQSTFQTVTIRNDFLMFEYGGKEYSNLVHSVAISTNDVPR